MINEIAFTRLFNARGRHFNNDCSFYELKENLDFTDIEVLIETELFLIDRSNFISDIKRIILWSDWAIGKRFINWMKHTLEYRSRNNRIFEKIIFAITWAFKEQKFIDKQTQHQFVASLNYLEDLFRTNIDFKDDEAKYIILNILILSIHPDYQKRSFLNYINNPKIKAFNSHMFSHLFTDKAYPKFLANHLLDLNENELKKLLELTQGKSIKSIIPVGHILSKTENAILNKNVLCLSDKNHILERYLYVSKILKIEPNELILIKNILECSKIYRDNFRLFKDDIEFWQTVFHFFSKNTESINSSLDIREIIDYVEFKRYHPTEGSKIFNIKGRSLSSLKKDIEEWHFNIALSDFFYEQLKWQGLDIEKWQYTFENIDYCIEEIKTSERLLHESKSLKHCVITYVNHCANGSTSIFSLSKHKDNQPIPFFTIQVENNTITQIAGLKNSEPKKYIIKMINLWAKTNNIKTHS